jgi:hypothetical protein
MKVAARAYVSTLRFNTSSCRVYATDTKRVINDRTGSHYETQLYAMTGHGLHSTASVTTATYSSNIRCLTACCTVQLSDNSST